RPFKTLLQGALQHNPLIGSVQVKELKWGFVLGAHALLSIA
ncbi:MAG: hypothetical protein RL069_1811, partial [Planctomycetota bacterium]